MAWDEERLAEIERRAALLMGESKDLRLYVTECLPRDLIADFWDSVDADCGAVLADVRALVAYVREQLGKAAA